MDAQGTSDRTLDVESAERIAGFLAGQSGVFAVTVAGPDGAHLASGGAGDGATEAALAAFIGERASEVTAADDLRGMGKLVSESAFQKLAVSGPRGEALVFSLEGGYLFVSASIGQLAVAEQSAVPVISRFGPAAAGRRGG
ncbi:MAG: hypothetical protein ACRDHF_03325 [Tepidiformaceae bacterium]